MNLNEEAGVKVARIKTLMLGTMNDKEKLQAIYAVCFPPKQKTFYLVWWKGKTAQEGIVTIIENLNDDPYSIHQNNELIAVKKITLTEGEGLTPKT